jgi:hypothetical protein
MRIAIGFFGVVSGLLGNSGTRSAGQEICLQKMFESYTNFLVDCNTDCQIDFFVHSWSVELQDLILTTIQPKIYKIEPQVNINIPTHLPNVPRVFNAFSRWYSTKELSSIIADHEHIHGEYDMIMISRFDVIWQQPLIFNLLDRDAFYVSNVIDPWPLPGDGDLWGWPHTGMPELSDHWFISNSRYMHDFCNVYNYLDTYTLPGQCPSWNYISQHMITKWHLNKLGLQSKIKFTKFWHKNQDSGDYSIIRHIKN